MSGHFKLSLFLSITHCIVYTVSRRAHTVHCFDIMKAVGLLPENLVQQMTREEEERSKCPCVTFNFSTFIRHCRQLVSKLWQMEQQIQSQYSFDWHPARRDDRLMSHREESVHLGLHVMVSEGCQWVTTKVSFPYETTGHVRNISRSIPPVRLYFQQEHKLS